MIDSDNPFVFFSQWISYSISLFAVMADVGAFFSGSVALAFLSQAFEHIICHMPESDLNLYIPATLEGVTKLVFVFNTSGAQWHNTLSNQLIELAEYNATFVTLPFIQDISRKVFEDDLCSGDELERYLTNSLKPTTKMHEEFIHQFCLICEWYARNNPHPRNKEDDQLWIFDNGRCTTYVPNEKEEKVLGLLIRMFREASRSELGECLATLKRLWVERMCNEKLFVKYVTYRVHKAIPGISQKKIMGDIIFSLKDITSVQGLLKKDTPFLQLNDLAEHKATFVPLSFIRDVSQNCLESERFSGEKLKNYLTTSLQRTTVIDRKFIRQFCKICGQYSRNNPHPTEKEEDKVWIFDDGKCTTYRPAEQEEEILRNLIDMFPELCTQVDVGEILAKLKEFWVKRMCNEKLFVKYVTYRVHKAKPWLRRNNTTGAIVGLSDHKALHRKTLVDTDLRSLQLDDLVKYNVTLVPLSAIQTISRKVFKHKHFSKEELIEYLTTSLEPISATKNKFIDRFYTVCERYASKSSRSRKGDSSNQVWIFDADRDNESIYCPSIEEDEILKTLGDIYTNIEGGDPEARIVKLKRLWVERGYSDRLFIQYIAYRVRKDQPHMDHKKIMQWIKILLASGDYTNSRVVQGKLNGTDLQLILLKPDKKKGQALRTILKFYASHVMSLVSGTVGAHLYYAFAKEGRSYKWDFTGNPMQKRAELSIEKWMLRGWTFHVGDTFYRTRKPGDRHGKIVDFKEFYEEAYKEVKNTDKPLDPGWNAMMERQRDELETCSWVEGLGSLHLPKDRNATRSTYSRISDWVEAELKGHKYVIGKDEWMEERLNKAKLDVYFSGAGHLFDEEFKGYNRL